MTPAAPLDLDAAEDAIRRCNTSAEFLGADGLMHRHFATTAMALDAGSMAERVVLVNGVWATQMFWRRGVADRVIERLRTDGARMLLICEGLDQDALERAPEQVQEAAWECMPIALGHTGGEAAGGPYSFASKFLHWTTRRHFPIMDSRARVAIRHLQLERGRPTPRLPQNTGDLPWSEDYPRWIAFYSDVIRSLAPADRERLLRADLDSQPGDHRHQNTLLRVLDKVFYTLGSDSAHPPPA